MLEYSSPSGIGPRAGGGAETAPLKALLLPAQDADIDTDGDGEASWGVSLAHMVLVPFEAPAMYINTASPGKHQHEGRKHGRKEENINK